MRALLCGKNAYALNHGCLRDDLTAGAATLIWHTPNFLAKIISLVPARRAAGDPSPMPTARISTVDTRAGHMGTFILETFSYLRGFRGVGAAARKTDAMERLRFDGGAVQAPSRASCDALGRRRTRCLAARPWTSAIPAAVAHPTRHN